MILLDTSAIIWLQIAHPWTRQLARLAQPLNVSPASMLELQFWSKPAGCNSPPTSHRSPPRWAG